MWCHISGRASWSRTSRRARSPRLSMHSSPAPIAAPPWAQRGASTPSPRLRQNPSPDATPPSTSRSPQARNAWLSAIKALIVVAALYWVGKMIVGSIRAIQHGDLVLHVSPGWLVLSAVIVLSTNALLIWAWLYLVAGLSGGSIPFL